MADSTRTTEALSRLTGGIASLCSTDRWKEYLDAARLFHDYSFANTLLIHGQAPWASRVAGFHTWRKLGRFVRKGERAIWVLAPITVRRDRDEADDTDREPQRRLAVAFKAVPVFDIRSTDGEPLPESPCHRLTGDDPNDAFERLEHVALMFGYSVDVEPLPGERNGDTTFADRSIRVRDGLAPAQMVKTLCHELGHGLLHQDFAGSRGLAECEAESVAYVVCADLGLDSSEYSFGYVAGWAAGGDEAIKAITASGNRIQHAAQTIIEALERQAVAA